MNCCCAASCECEAAVEVSLRGGDRESKSMDAGAKVIEEAAPGR
jgi:hypothetical protein